jgi:nitrite reductase/ring-hydroxylating ferredoxin subunit
MDHCTGDCGCARARVEQAGEPRATTLSGAGRWSDDRGSVSRREVLTGSAAALAALALASCATTEEASSPGSSTPVQSPTAESSAPSEATSAAPSDGAASPTGEALATTTEFPVGGGKVVQAGGSVVVVTEPADGEFKAFDGRCPHAGCPVAEVTENTIRCPCHGSTFDGSTGDRLEGPAPTGLTPVAITVVGDTIYLA